MCIHLCYFFVRGQTHHLLKYGKLTMTTMEERRKTEEEHTRTRRKTRWWVKKPSINYMCLFYLSLKYSPFLDVPYEAPIANSYYMWWKSTVLNRNYNVLNSKLCLICTNKCDFECIYAYLMGEMYENLPAWPPAC